MSFFLPRPLQAGQTGNTLMELILVMVIFTIGATVAVPRMQTAWDARKLERSAKILEDVANAIRIYDMENLTIAAAAVPGEFHNSILDTDLTGLLAKLEVKGFLNQADLSPGFCYTWKTVPSEDPLTGKLTGVARIQSALRTSGVCSTNANEQAVYVIDFNRGRGQDQKIIGTRSPKTKLSNSDTF